MVHGTRGKFLAGRRGIVMGGVIVVTALGAALYWAQRGPLPAAAAEPHANTVPVTIATASRADVPIYLSGLGTVQASNTVSIHSQVDGKLQDVLFTEGQHVNKGDALAKIDPRLFQAALDQAKAKKAQDQAQLVAAQKDLARFTDLAAKSFESQQNVDRQRAQVDQLKASIAADDGAIEAAQTQLDYTTVTAPIAGRMGVRLVDAGNVVHAADQTAIATLTQTQPIAVMFTLPAQSLDAVRDAQRRGAVEVSAYDRDNKRALAKGTLLLIDNMIDQTTATMKLKAMFSNEDEALWPGEFVNARLLLETRKDAVTIPSAAVQRGPNGLFAWVVNGDGKAEMRPLEVGATSGDTIIVTSGLTTGDRVVTDGQFKLQQNAAVSINQPAATPAPAPVPAGRNS
jgi:multidrug efflux system membrane fusion protein